MTLEIYRSDNNTTPVLTAQFPRSGEPPINRPGVWQWSWDGRLADGSLAERGVYLYRVRASTRCLFVTDGDSNRSDYLRIERAQDASGQPILEAAYWGYDDQGTPEDESDDEHLYFVRWYALRSDRNASSGQIWLFDPSLQRVGVWDLSQLPCVEHNNQLDGLVASSSGVRHGVIVRVPVSVMSAEGEYLFMVHAVDDHADMEHWHRRLPALELNSQLRIAIDRVRVLYHNDTNRDSPYPFADDAVSVRALVWMRAGNGGSYPFWCEGFNNDGRWYATGTQGDAMPPLGKPWSDPAPPVLSEQRVYTWRGPSLRFTWYRLRSVVDMETILTEDIHTTRPITRRYYIYPPYDPAGITGWGIRTAAANLVPRAQTLVDGSFHDTTYRCGTVRLMVEVRWRDARGEHTMFSLGPTPGPWRPPDNDQNEADWSLHWSQNCDESAEWAVRISVRYNGLPEDIVPSERQLRFLQWASAYYPVPYEWGGSWFVGRADNDSDVSGAPGENHYGIDCSGLVSAAAGWAGYNWNPWRVDVGGIILRSDDLGRQSPDVRPGDVLTWAEHHVKIIFNCQPGHVDQPTAETLEAAADEGRDDDNRVTLRRNVRIRDLIGTVQNPDDYQVRRLRAN